MEARAKTEEEGEEQIRGIVVMPNIPGFTQKYNKIARKHNFRVANNTEKRVKDLISNANNPLGGKKY